LRLKGLAVLAICLVARAGAGAQAEEPPACPVTGPNAAPYLVGPGDLLRVNVWKEPELTLELTVRIDGMITLPLLGDVQASGRAPSELASRIALELEEFIEKPHVSVAVVEARSARVYVVGRISRPGELPLSACMTVLQALALAGGLTEFAKADKISIVRDDGSVVPVNYDRIVDGKDVAQNAYLAAGDTIVVP
jgi:polysaccharide export outer membrane protein